jgi:ATP-binding cassette, subfamily B, bacterial HlyB/CyaB
MQNWEVGREDLVWLLGSLCALYRVPFDASLLTQAYTPPYSDLTVHEAARALEFRTGNAPVRSADWSRMPMPCVGFLRELAPQTAEAEPAAPPTIAPTPEDGSEPLHTPLPKVTPILIVGLQNNEVVYFPAGTQTPQTLRLADVESRLAEEMILVSREATAKTGEDDPVAGFAEEKREFGFRWFVPELMKHKRIWRDVLIASLCIQLVGLATPLFTQVIIDKVVVHQTHSTLWVLGVALIMFMLFTSVMTWLRQYLILHTGNRIDAVLGSQVFRHLLHLPMPYFDHRPTGTLVARLHGVETIREFVSGAAITLILDFPFLIIFLAVMFWYSWQLSLIAVVLLGLIATMSFFVAPLFRDRLNKQFMLGARNQAFLTEYVAGMGTVKALQMEPDLDRKYGDYLAQYLGAGFRTKQIGNTYNVVASGLEQTMTLSILVAGALLVMQNGGFTVGMLVAFQMFAGRMSQPLMRIVGLWQEFQQASIAVKRLGDVLDMPQEPHALIPHRERGGGHLEVKGLGFRYSEHHPWLYRNLNLEFKPGELTVVMGPSGCGKSTLAKLMLGFYQPQEGSITLDGKDIRYLAANELRSVFGVVPQETVLFSGTIYDNLVMAHPHATFEDVVEACKKAEIHDAIELLPKGYQTEIGERGTGLSGGQRQRIAIARALIKKPAVLVFDEAVSNLDELTAESFAKTANRMKTNFSTIFITHSVPRSLSVDKTILLNNVFASGCGTGGSVPVS